VREIASASSRNALQVYIFRSNGSVQLKGIATMTAHLETPGLFVLLGISTCSSGAVSMPNKAAIAVPPAAFPTQFL
jgi:hypothetical protein